MCHFVAEEKWKSTRPQLLTMNMPWLVDWLGWQLDFQFFATRKELFSNFWLIRMILVVLCQNKRTTCTETALCVLKFQLNFRNKNGHSLSDSNLICKSKAVSKSKIKVNSWSKMHGKLYLFWDSGKMIAYGSSWGNGALSESSLRKQAL